MQCVHAYFACLTDQGFRPRDLAKAQVQAFLASRAEPGKRLGEAAAGYWPWESPGFEDLRQFLVKFARG